MIKGSRLMRRPAAPGRAGDSRLLGPLLLVALLGVHTAHAGTGSDPMPAGAEPASHAPGGPAVAALERERASAEVRYMAGWVESTRDNQALPYIFVDKVDAKVYVFDAEGRLQGSAAALLGMVPGDGSADGIGDRALSAIGPSERTTPAGRFLASVGPDLHGKDILWVDYDTALALHRVAKGTPAERRAQRLDSPTASDNRISYGCINVPVPFYETFIGPPFKQTGGVVYILPEMSSAREVFKPDVPDTALDAVRHRP